MSDQSIDRKEFITPVELADTPPPHMMIEGILPSNAIMMLQARGGVGKTNLALEWAISLASGQPALKRFVVPQKERVLYVQEDCSRVEMAAQFRKVARAKGITPADLEWGEYAHELKEEGGQALVTPSIIFRIGYGGALLDDQMAIRLRDIVEKEGYKLVVMDTFRDQHIASEIDNDEMASVHKRLRYLREKATILLVAHTAKPSESERKGADRVRGASSNGGVLDGCLEIRYKQNGQYRLTIEKSRSARLLEFTYTMEWTDDKIYFEVVQDKSPTRRVVINCMRAGYKRIDDMVAAVEAADGGKNQASRGGARSRVHWTLNRLLAEGLIIREGRGRYVFTDQSAQDFLESTLVNLPGPDVDPKAEI
jgi:KaiC/GvpD/RAD55 family RecA-like ATPase